ncbi:MAG: hypothetical protein K8J08_08020 [Thermoanaerobaculia bacterium]|nr:hypothetical protein [Thermoanaerobaculia bacterium]
MGRPHQTEILDSIFEIPKPTNNEQLLIIHDKKLVDRYAKRLDGAPEEGRHPLHEDIRLRFRFRLWLRLGLWFWFWLGFGFGFGLSFFFEFRFIFRRFGLFTDPPKEQTQPLGSSQIPSQESVTLGGTEHSRGFFEKQIEPLPNFRRHRGQEVFEQVYEVRRNPNSTAKTPPTGLVGLLYPHAFQSRGLIGSDPSTDHQELAGSTFELAQLSTGVSEAG